MMLCGDQRVGIRKWEKGETRSCGLEQRRAGHLRLFGSVNLTLVCWEENIMQTEVIIKEGGFFGECGGEVKSGLIGMGGGWLE